MTSVGVCVYKIPYVEISVKIPSRYVSLLQRGGPERPTLYGFRLLYLKHERRGLVRRMARAEQT